MKKLLLLGLILIFLPLFTYAYKNKYLNQSAVTTFFPQITKIIPKDLKSIEELNTLPGFYIDYYANDVEGARSLTISDNGIVYVGSRAAGKVYALIDTDTDYKADEVKVIASGMNSPNGVAWHDGDLYVAEISRVSKFVNIDDHLENLDFERSVIYSALPTDTHHGWKYIDIGPDDKLYVPVGAPCNICQTDNSPYATINRMNLDGSNFEIIARGIRNTVGFDWHPESNKLYFTDNGRDQLGDNVPADEFNVVDELNEHFGYPYCHAKNVVDPGFGTNTDCSLYKKPVQELGPHVAALGVEFYTGAMFPEKFKNVAFIAEHGSWNRTDPIGYRITTVNTETNNYDLFIDGWLKKDGNAWGRPVDVEQMEDGSLLVSDDLTGSIYRIVYY